MKKVIGILEKILKLCVAVLTMEVAAYVYSGVRYGFDCVRWAEFSDLIIGYPFILGCVYAVLHGRELLDKLSEIFKIRSRKPNLIVMKDGEIEGH